MCQILKIFYEFKSTNLVTNLIRDLFLKHKSSLFTNDKIIPLSIAFKWLFCNLFKLVWLLITKNSNLIDSPNEIVEKIWIFSNVQFNRFAMGEELCQSLGCVGYRLFIFILKFMLYGSLSVGRFDYNGAWISHDLL